MKIKDALALKPEEIISLVGGGGKTTVMFALAHELAAGGSRVITTTTTKIMIPSPRESAHIILAPDEKELVARAQRELGNHNLITVATAKLPSGKLDSISLETVAALAETKKADYIIIEADGAAHRPLKAPRENEPVISPLTTLVIAVIGVDALEQKLTEDYVFRAELAAKLLEVPPGTTITPVLIAKLITLPAGITKGSPETARIVPFLNKINIAGGLSKGRQIARAILAMRHPQINTVILGQAQSADPVIEIQLREE